MKRTKKPIMKRTKKPAFKRTKKPTRSSSTFTFKREKDAIYNGFQQEYGDILLGDKLVGAIVEWKWAEPSLGRMRLRFMVQHERTVKDPLPFIWVTIPQKFNQFSQAKKYAEDNCEALQKKYNLYLMNTDY